MKKCVHCGILKEDSDFNKNKRYKDGLQSWCKKFTNEYSAIRNKYKLQDPEHRLQKAEYQREYRKLNPEKRIHWQANNKERINSLQLEGRHEKGVNKWYRKGPKFVSRQVYRNSHGEEYGEGWNEIRKKIYKRDNWICQIPECNVHCTTSGKTKIQCHHIDYDIKNNCPNNLITLCVSCHMKTNRNKLYWLRYFRERMRYIMEENTTSRVVGVTENQVNEWKSKYGDLFMINLGEEQYVYRPIKRFEYKTVMNNPEANRAYNEEKIVQMCVIHPTIDAVKIPAFKAGTISTLVELIMAASNFGITEEPIKL